MELFYARIRLFFVSHFLSVPLVANASAFSRSSRFFFFVKSLVDSRCRLLSTPSVGAILLLPFLSLPPIQIFGPYFQRILYHPGITFSLFNEIVPGVSFSVTSFLHRPLYPVLLRIVIFLTHPPLEREISDRATFLSTLSSSSSQSELVTPLSFFSCIFMIGNSF